VRRWWLVIGLLLSVGVNAGVLATLAAHRFGAEKQPKPQKPAEKPIPLPNVPNAQPGEPQRIIRLADRLGLEGEQRKRFIRLQGSFFAETVRLRTEQAETQRELRRVLAAPQPDRQRIESLLQESGRSFVELERAMAENVMSSRRLLNPEQEREFLRLVASLRPFGGGGGGGLGQGQRQGQRPGPQTRQQMRQELLQELRQEQRQRMLERRRQMGLGPPGDAQDRPPGPNARQTPQGAGQSNANGPPFRQRRPGAGRGAWWNRRFGGQGNRPGAPGAPATPADTTPAAETPPADTPPPR